MKPWVIKFLYHINPFSFVYWFHNNLNTLKRQMNIYFMLFPQKRKLFASELDFVMNRSTERQLYSFVFPYSFTEDYISSEIEVYNDKALGLFYVLHDNKKLYYSRDYKTEASVRENYNYIRIEQDKKSPHCYMTSEFKVCDKDVVFDIGAAEGNFSLEIVEKASALYIFESNNNWIEALQATFEPWKQKVHIINKFVTDIQNDKCISLSSFIGDIPVSFIKMDVEGAEVGILRNVKSVLNESPFIKLAVCTYHNNSDAHQIENIFDECGYRYSYSNGFVLFIHSRLTPPYFRKGMIRAQKAID